MDGERIKYEIKKKGYTIKRIAEELNTSQQNLSAKLNSDDVSSGLIEQICNIIGVMMPDLYSDGDSIPAIDNAGTKTTIKSRLQTAAREMGYSDRGFCLACGLRPDWLNHLGDYVKEIDIQKVFSAFPSLNLYYIFLGKSPMFYAESVTPSSTDAIRFIFDEYKEMKVENRMLVAENAVLKEKIHVIVSDMEKISKIQ